MARPKLYDDALRDRLIDAAAARIADGGVSALALRAVAGDCATSTTAIYSLIGTKEDLVQAVRDHAAASFAADQRAVPLTDDPVADLAELGRAYRRWAITHPDLYAVMFGGRPHLTYDHPTEGSPAHEAPEAMLPLLEHVERSVRATGGDVSLIPEIAMSTWGVVHGSVGLELAHPGAAGDTWPQHFESQLRMLAHHWFRNATPGHPQPRAVLPPRG